MAKSPFDLLKYVFILGMTLFSLSLGLILKEPVFEKDWAIVLAFLFCFIAGTLAIIKGILNLLSLNTDLSLDQTIMFILAGGSCLIFGSSVFLLLFPNNSILLGAFEVGKNLSALIAGIALLIGVFAFGRKRVI